MLEWKAVPRPPDTPPPSPPALVARALEVYKDVDALALETRNLIRSLTDRVDALEGETRPPRDRSDTVAALEAGRLFTAAESSGPKGGWHRGPHFHPVLKGRVAELEARVAGLGSELSQLKTEAEGRKAESHRARAAQSGVWLLAQRVLRLENRVRRRRKRLHLRLELIVSAVAAELKGIEEFVYNEFLWVGPDDRRNRRFKAQACHPGFPVAGPSVAGDRPRGGVWPQA